jgi:hypothetical protein
MKSLARTIIGLLIVAVGASFLLTNLDILPFDVGIAQWWPHHTPTKNAPDESSDLRVTSAISRQLLLQYRLAV